MHLKHAGHGAQARAAPGAPPVLTESQDVTLESLSRQAGWEDENFVEASRQRSEGQVVHIPVGQWGSGLHN